MDLLEAEEHIERAISTWMEHTGASRAEAAVAVYEQALEAGEDVLVEVAGVKARYSMEVKVL